MTSAEGASPLAPWTLVPWCATPAPARPDTWYEAAVFLGEDGEPPAVEWTGPSALRITWPDGTADEIDASPAATVAPA
ncbi:hypothetical protein [Thermocatellispora tengchongensis]|uniref:hypothetical protein n=1 Tax=Thermocatellispora tengchongensis TaxID=1073253 RepID=UPI003633D992